MGARGPVKTCPGRWLVSAVGIGLAGPGDGLGTELIGTLG